MIVVIGCAGFIGSNFVYTWLAQTNEPLVNLDKLTYAGNIQNLAALRGDPRHIFVRGDIADRELVGRLLLEHQPRAVINFAAESHVDRSIHGPSDFIQTNVMGTFELLESVRAYCRDLPGPGAFWARVRGDRRIGGGALQEHRLLVPRARTEPALE